MTTLPMPSITIPIGTVPIGSPARLLRIAPASVEEAGLVRQIMQEAFAEYLGVLEDPPSGAHSETVADVERAMAEGGAILVWEGATAVASARFRLRPDYLYVERLAVVPTHRGQGIASAMLAYGEQVARACGREEVRLGTRMVMERNLALYQRLGYEIVGIRPHPKGTSQVVMLIKRLAAPSDETGNPSDETGKMKTEDSPSGPL